MVGDPANLNLTRMGEATNIQTDWVWGSFGNAMVGHLCLSWLLADFSPKLLGCLRCSAAFCHWSWLRRLGKSLSNASELSCWNFKENTWVTGQIAARLPQTPKPWNLFFLPFFTISIATCWPFCCIICSGILPFLCTSEWWLWESVTTSLLLSLVVQHLTFAPSCWYI